MKEINEELQMRIFDLLEGNLSEKEKAEVLNLIASSAELQKEYLLMSKTYLRDEERIVFADKYRLYRKPGLILTWAPMMRYAAAVAIFAVVGTAGWYFFKNNDENKTSISHSKKPATTVDAPLKTQKSPASEVEESAQKNAQIQPYHIKKQAPNPEQKQEADLIPVIPENPFKNSVAISGEVPDPITEIAINILPETMDTKDSSGEVIVQQMPVKSGTKRSLSYKLLNNSRQMLANLQLPDIKFRAEKNANRNIPTIKMEIRTLKTDVIATLIE